ncbi:hypothetical protein [Curtobacterium sp. TXMA1]|uniref:hypothetical protein n=1 Tax=Curtobacterium sp. TXMA1 TaxID=2876939 RepID=UPI001CCABF3F|nr:hypothetical protein [Curtobacterium sp. TXMA1]UBQ01320.1 hypothetical protein LCG91_09370 [Curtobacterium sp. TXMA1]
MSDLTRPRAAARRARGVGRHARRSTGRRPLVLTVLALATYVVLLVLVIGTATVAVSRYSGRDEPVHWGSFRLTEPDCSRDRSGKVSCLWYGTWTPDDGSRPIRDVQYDGGSLDPEDPPVGDVRTGYRDSDLLDAEPGTVWNADDIDSTWVTPAIVAGVCALLLTFLVFDWGDAGRLRRWWQRRRAESGR